MNPAKRREIFLRLQAANPHPTTELEYHTPFELLVAVMLSAVLGVALTAVLPPEQMTLWGWRIPIVIGCLIIPLVFYLRRSLEETEAFRCSTPVKSSLVASAPPTYIFAPVADCTWSFAVPRIRCSSASVASSCGALVGMTSMAVRLPENVVGISLTSGSMPVKEEVKSPPAAAAGAVWAYAVEINTEFSWFVVSQA